MLGGLLFDQQLILSLSNVFSMFFYNLKAFRIEIASNSNEKECTSVSVVRLPPFDLSFQVIEESL